MTHLSFRLKIFMAVFLIVMGLGTFSFMVTENLSLFDAFYFNIVTMATVGYGDIHPTTAKGKILAIFIIILGTGTFLGVVANATEIMLSRREKIARLQKRNLIIGVYFSEIGSKLLASCINSDPLIHSLRETLLIGNDWHDSTFSAAAGKLADYEYGVDMERIDLKNLYEFLADKRKFLVDMLENPMLLEHEIFTEHLQAVFHLLEELSFRPGFASIPLADKNHLAGDIKRVYALLVPQWLTHMKYLKNNYPFLFSLAVRINPFNPKAAATVNP